MPARGPRAVGQTRIANARFPHPTAVSTRSATPRAHRVLRAVVGLLAVACLGFGLGHLYQARAGLAVQHTQVGAIPVTIYRNATAPPGAGAQPLVVIAHGFAGSQQLMQPLALTLAHNGYLAVTFDFPGHGRDPLPMTGGMADQEQSLRTLLAALEQVTTWARTLVPNGAGYALLAHSMASDIAVRHAQKHPEVWATVALSLFTPIINSATPPDSPHNLLVVTGALEPGAMHREALRVVGVVAGPNAQERVTYGHFEDGTARRAAFAAGVEHISVLYSVDTAQEAVAWLDRALGRAPATQAVVVSYGPALGALLLGILGLGWLLAQALPRLVAPPADPASPGATESARWPWRRFLALALLPALATPLLLWKAPGDFLPILLGDYLMLHFGLYGALTALAIWHQGGAQMQWPDPARTLAATVVVTGFGLLAVGLPVNTFVFNLTPVPQRWLLILALAAGTLPWFLADEALTRSAKAPRGAYVLTKVCFLLSLVLAIALNPGRLFFLALIVPAILLLFMVYGWFSRWTFRQTGCPLVGAISNGVVFAWFMAVTFPLVA